MCTKKKIPQIVGWIKMTTLTLIHYEIIVILLTLMV